jgi:hypothetical protein
MKKAIIAGVALLSSAGALAGVAAAHPASASIGCGITVYVHNKTNSDITVQWDQSDSKLDSMFATWKKLGSGTTTIHAGNTASRAFTLDFSCASGHQYRVHYTKPGSSAYAYAPANLANVSYSTTPDVNVN